jgi:hypothetical protein|tara:strand:- start:1913 stop:2152 length:240 start_codon:yes stop_codon:yes gene_type:complete
MADRFPLILNTGANQIQEIPTGDNLDLTGNNIKSVSYITFAGMSTTDRNNLSAAAGMVIYNSSTNKLQCYNGSSWNDLF